MLRPRLIPILTMRDKGLVKTKKFGNEKYVGDPLNAVRIFNEFSCDELIFLDIDASVKEHEPDFNLIRKISSECRMPLCYGGGIKSVHQVEKILGLGVEKISVSSIIFDDESFIRDVASITGSQSLVVCLDVKKNFFSGKYECYVNNGKKKIKDNLENIIVTAQEMGAGEILINSIDRDGTKSHFDHELVEKIKNYMSVPLTICGGAKNFESFSNLYAEFGIVGAAGGSVFVFEGRFDAVLINYPNQQIKEDIIYLET